jgi:two-component system, OmpR family, sensor histidine kinase TctE
VTAARGQGSLFGEILDWMLAPLLLIWPMSVALTWLVAQGIANRPYDRELGELASTMAREVIAEYSGGRVPPSTSMARRLDFAAAQLVRADNDDTIYYQVLGARGELIAGEANLPVPPDEPFAYNTVLYRDELLQDIPVRVAYIWLPLGAAGSERNAVVQMAEGLDKRSQLATEIIKGVILPQFVVLPVAVLLVWFALSRAIKPLSELQQRIRLRASNDLSPIPERDVPEEVAPLVAAINDLLQRLDASMSAQRHFLADAAHQLKTPLAGLRTQAELAERQIEQGVTDLDAIKHPLRQIALSSQRAAHMVNQLLSMARAEDQSGALQREAVDLAPTVVETVRDFVPRALAKHIDLGYEGPEPNAAAAAGSAGSASPEPEATANARSALILGHEVLVRELVRNLVDNALLYTPEGGTITVRLQIDPYNHAVELQVEDSGPGIAVAEREHVFRPFYRVLGSNVDGSGLGLAIVKEIADQHEASLRLQDANTLQPPLGPGVLFTVRFPAQRLTSE